MKTDIILEMGEFRRLIRESSTEQGFRPVVGNSVEKDNKTNNEKTYKETEKKIKDYDGGSKEKKTELEPKRDGNRTTLDYVPATEPDKNYKERIEAQAKGYTSKMEEENGIEKAAQFDDDGKVFKQFKEASDELNKQRADLAHSGLQARELPKNKTKTLYEGSEIPKEKILRFKGTSFVNEKRMLSLIPEEYKKHGQRIHMIDKIGDEYIVESTQSKYTGAIETKVVDYKSKQRMDEQMKRINELFEYKSGTTSGVRNKEEKLNEDTQFKDLMDMVRSCKK